jgi:UDP-N-acetylglucosamine 2-epimerase (non-hydrolysing)
MKKLKEKGKINLSEGVLFSKPLGFIDYIKIQQNAFCVLSDSGTITEESSILNFPAITIRQAHERPEGMDEGTLIMTGLKKEKILDAIDVVTSQHDINHRVFKLIEDYDVDNVSKKVVRIIMSYVEYINRTIWYK